MGGKFSETFGDEFSDEFGEKFCDKFVTKCCEKYSDSPNCMLSPTVIGVGLHRLGLKSNFGQVEVQRGEAELDFNWTEIGLHWSCTR